ncbi:MAG: amino acid permease, partial [Terracidiphilus sp.]
ISLAFVAVVPMEQIQSNTAFVGQFGRALFGAAGGRVLSICVLLCAAGGLMVLSMAVPRVTFALARSEVGVEGRGVLGALGRLNPRSGVPGNAVLLQTAMALAVLGLGAFDRILAFIIFSGVIFLALTAATLFRAAMRSRLWWYPLAPITFIAGCAVLALMLLMHNPGPSLLGAGIVLAGLPARWLLTPRRRAPEPVVTQSGLL